MNHLSMHAYVAAFCQFLIYNSLILIQILNVNHTCSDALSGCSWMSGCLDCRASDTDKQYKHTYTQSNL